MKLNDLRVCDLCRQPVSGNTRDVERYGRSIDFRVLIVERYLLDGGALQRHAGLSLMLGGSERLAMAMGQNEDAAVAVMRVELYVCNPCFYEKLDALHELPEDCGKKLPTPEADRIIERSLTKARSAEPRK